MKVGETIWIWFADRPCEALITGIFNDGRVITYRMPWSNGALNFLNRIGFGYNYCETMGDFKKRVR